MSQFAFKRTGDADYPRYLKVLLQGPPKSGKTTFLTTAPNVVVAAVEAGLMSIAHKDVAYVEVDGTNKLQTLHMILADDAMRAKAAQQLGLPAIETVAIDTLDAWQELLKKEIMLENRRTSFQRDDWGTLKERMASILKAFVALPLNVIFTVHTTTSQDEEARLIYTPNLQGSIKDDIAGYVDFSLLSFRQREVDSTGTPAIKYYLKNEGDLKNPHLGNRAAGRLPEICEPDFKILHDAVFAGIPDRVVSVPTDITVEVSAPVPAPQPAAQSVSQPVSVQNAPSTGVPADDSDKPVTAAGITMLTKEYTAQGFQVPDDLGTWNLGKARQVARFFTAWKADMATGNGSRDEIVAYLQGCDAWVGEIPSTTLGTAKVKVTKAPEPVAEPVQEDEPVADAVQAPAESVPSLDEAVATVEQQLGGVVIGHEVSADSLCETCGEKVDDVDIARLALNRFRKVLCVSDYKAETRK